MMPNFGYIYRVMDRGKTVTQSFQDALRKSPIGSFAGSLLKEFQEQTGKEIALDEAINLGMIKLGQTYVTSTRKTSTTSIRKTSNIFSVSSRLSSNASSRSNPPPKSLSSAQEFSKESS